MKGKFILTFLLLFSVCYAQNDCQDALTVCGNMGYENLNATGFGVQELNNSNTCESAENNSLWLRLPISTGGTLGFILKPESPDIVVDFDFFIFGPNATCGNIGQAIRCSTTNPQASGAANNLTGMNDTEMDTAEGPGFLGNNFVQWLTVQDGETYFLVIDRPIGSSNFSIEWTGTATFHDSPVYNNPQGISIDLAQCDDDTVDDQSVAFDLTTYAAMLLGAQQNVTLTYHLDLNDVTTGQNPVANPGAFANTTNPHTIYMRMTNTITGCFEIESFEIEVTNPVVAGEPEDLFLCDLAGNGLQTFNLALNSDLIRNGVPSRSVVYYASQQDAENEVNPLNNFHQNAVPGMAQTIWARVENTTGCFGHDITSFTINIIPLPEVNYTLEIQDFTNRDNSIAIEMPNPGDFEFSIDGQNYSDNNVFDNLEPGPYTVFIRSKDHCRTVSEEIIILNYPKFFTPNGDGENETWRIPYLFLQPSAQVTIFDRYGRLITGFTGDGPGWDGTFNSVKLPSTDYWFVLQLDSGRIIKGHFSMVR